jgi:hypothetical protein
MGRIGRMGRMERIGMNAGAGFGESGVDGLITKPGKAAWA